MNEKNIKTLFLAVVFVTLFSAVLGGCSENAEQLSNDITLSAENFSTEQPNNGEETTNEMKITIGDTVLTAKLETNAAVDALKEMLKQGPLTLVMTDYAQMEKGADLGTTLPEDNQSTDVRSGDIMLYQGRTLVIYYDTNTWSLTRIGRIEGIEEKDLRELLGPEDVTVTFSLD